MTSFVIEQFHAPDTNRRARKLDSVRRRAVDHLAGRSVWCIAAAPAGAQAADALEHCLGGLRDQGVVSRRGEDALWNGRQDADALLPGEVRPGDVVVLHDLIAAALAPAIRERGAHAVWRTSIGPWENNAAAAWRFLHRSPPAVDAYVTGWHSGSAASARRAGIAAYIAASTVVSAKEVDTGGAGGVASSYEEIGWTTLLADVVRDDRAERVGGTFHARPSIAAR